jgi:hypothetical protein
LRAQLIGAREHRKRILLTDPIKCSNRAHRAPSSLLFRFFLRQSVVAMCY